MAGRRSKPPVPVVASPTRWAALPFLCLAAAVTFADNTLVAAAIPSDVSSQTTWMMNGYLVAFVAAVLPAGALADRYGRRMVLIVSLATLAVVSTIAARVSDPYDLWQWRILTGAAAGGVFPATLAVIADLFRDERERRIAVGAWVAATGVGLAAGPVMASAVTGRTWLWSAQVLVPICAVCVTGIWFFARESKDNLRFLDPVGIITGSVSATCVAVGLAVTQSDGLTAVSASSVLIGAAGFAGFVSWESHHEDPMIDVGVFRSRDLRGGMVAAAAAQVCVFAFILIGFEHMRYVLGYSPSQIVAAMVPFGVATTIGVVVGTNAVPSYGHRFVVAFGLILTTTGVFWAAGLEPSSRWLAVTAPLVLLGLGMGSATAPSTNLILGALPDSSTGAGFGFNALSRQIGAVLGAGVAGSVTAASYPQRIEAGFAGTLMPQYGVDAAAQSIHMAALAKSTIESMVGPDAGTAVQNVVNEAFSQATGSGLRAAALIGVWAVVVVIWLLPAWGENVGGVKSRWGRRAADRPGRHGRHTAAPTHGASPVERPIFYRVFPHKQGHWHRWMDRMLHLQSQSQETQ